MGDSSYTLKSVKHKHLMVCSKQAAQPKPAKDTANAVAEGSAPCLGW